MRTTHRSTLNSRFERTSRPARGGAGSTRIWNHRRTLFRGISRGPFPAQTIVPDRIPSPFWCGTFQGSDSAPSHEGRASVRIRLRARMVVHDTPAFREALEDEGVHASQVSGIAVEMPAAQNKSSIRTKRTHLELREFK